MSLARVTKQRSSEGKHRLATSIYSQRLPSSQSPTSLASPRHLTPTSPLTCSTSLHAAVSPPFSRPHISFYLLHQPASLFLLLPSSSPQQRRMHQEASGCAGDFGIELDSHTCGAGRGRSFSGESGRRRVVVLGHAD